MEQDQPHDDLLLEDETASAVEQPGEADTDLVPLTEEPAGPASPPAPSRVASMMRGAARMLLAIALSQYVIVTVMIVVIAAVVAKYASSLLVEKFDAIAQALRSF